MKEEPSISFPKSFFWGASTSAHQVEGGTHNNWSVWELENAKALASAAEHKLGHLYAWEDIKDEAKDPDNYVSGKATDHFHKYKTDFAIARKLNLNAFRFSIEWSRIEPEKGVWSKEAIEHYRKYIKAMKDEGLEPFLTLYHWTEPVWFSHMGGFERARNIKYFVRFAEKVLLELGQDVTYITTINEPDSVAGHGYILLEWPPQKHSYVKAFWVYRNLLLAHKKVYRLAKKAGARYQVGFTKAYAWVHVADGSRMSKLTVWLDFLLRDDLVIKYVGKKHLDFLGVNYYFSDAHRGIHMQGESHEVNDLGWGMRPHDIKHVLKRLNKWHLPIVITENGVADRNDEYRQWWIAQTLAAIYESLQSGVKVVGYLHWSFSDNFEWAYGRWPRFGLVEIDYKNGFKRTVRPSALWYGRVVKKMRGIK